MKKCLILVLLLLPTVSLAAPSVRVLGSGTGTTASSSTGAKITPAKTANISKTATLGTNKGAATAGSRVGTLRAVPKVGSGVANTSASGAASRFPVITPAHSYSSVTKPQVTGGTTINVDLDNYYNKQEVNNIINALKEEDDPRIDAIRLVDPSNMHTKDLPDDYVYMWIEE